MIEWTTAIGPAHWASYIVNGDASGFDFSNTPGDAAGDRDKAKCDAWLTYHAAVGWRVVSCDDGFEPEFRDLYIHGLGRFAGDVLVYVLHREKNNL